MELCVCQCGMIMIPGIDYHLLLDWKAKIRLLDLSYGWRRKGALPVSPWHKTRPDWKSLDAT